ncbi:MAG TPA: peroxidase family protein [Hyphomicrobiaceae bacterium]|nr:peroxidase family protein [Hyphomicrobiaceae bacterium]
MHGLNLALSHVGPRSTLESGEQIASGSSTIEGLRHFLKPRPDQRFSADGRVESYIAGNGDPLRLLLRKLSSTLLFEDFWHDKPLPAGIAGPLPFDNPQVPSAYTYLLQLAAHDLVHSSVSLAGTGADLGVSGIVNSRNVPLTLETIYGGGPEVCPHAYKIDQAFVSSGGRVSRTRLRLGRLRIDNRLDASCPMRDVARGEPLHASDDPHRDPSASVWPSEALVADPRNDDHAILSQLTVLFHLLHNHLVDRMEALGLPSDGPSEQQAFRRFLAARTAVTLIYRHILRNDVLPRILHPDVTSWYGSNSPLEVAHGIPLEFTHGAFRFAHAMVRDRYSVTRDAPLDTERALQQSSHRGFGFLPVSTEWRVDWRRFVPVPGHPMPMNLSRRIGPSYPGVLSSSRLFPVLAPEAGAASLPYGLIGRDLMSASLAGLWSVPALTAELQGRLGAGLVPDFAAWQAALGDWLTAQSVFDAAEVATLAADPPLPFYCLFEASKTLRAGLPHDTLGGLKLGVIGSIIVADTFHGALQRNPVAFDAAATGALLKPRLLAMSAAILGAPAPFATLPEIGDFGTLVAYLIDSATLP